MGNICNASPAADTVPPLIAYGASLTLVGLGGGAAATRAAATRGTVVRRDIPLEDFFLGPGETVCASSELVVAVHLPLPQQPFGSAFGRLTRRRGVDLAVINMACAIDSSGITTFVFGAAGPMAVVARDESGELAQPDLRQSRRDELLQSLVAKTNPISDVRSGEEYRRAMLLTIGGRMLLQAQQRRTARGGGR